MNLFLLFFNLNLIIHVVLSLKCFAGLNEFSSSSLLSFHIENTDYVCGNNSDWDEIIINDGDWYCMVYFYYYNYYFINYY
jgi:hypothetical protein